MPMKRQLNWFLVKFLLLSLMPVLGFAVLYRCRIYPVLTTSQLFDSKMLDAQRRLPARVKLVIAGSSVALYDLDSKLIADSLERSFYNFASWGMQMSDIGAALRVLVKEYRPALVVICSCDRDFMTAPTPFNSAYVGTTAWIREDIPWYFYIRNYNPVRTLWRRRFRSRRPRMDAWGGAPVEGMWQGLPANLRDGLLDFPTAFTGLQYRALDSLCGFLKETGVRFAFVQVPVEARFAANRAACRLLAPIWSGAGRS